MTKQELIEKLKWYKQHTIDGMVNVHCAKCEHAGYAKAIQLVEQLDDPEECEIRLSSDEADAWEIDNEDFVDYNICTACNHYFQYSFHSFLDVNQGLHHCPNCGAKVKRD